MSPKLKLFPLTIGAYCHTDLKFCQWLCQNEYFPAKTDWDILTCSPEICQYLKDKGLKFEPNFFEELNSVQPEILGWK